VSQFSQGISWSSRWEKSIKVKGKKHDDAVGRVDLKKKWRKIRPNGTRELLLRLKKERASKRSQSKTNKRMAADNLRLQHLKFALRALSVKTSRVALEEGLRGGDNTRTLLNQRRPRLNSKTSMTVTEPEQRGGRTDPLKWVSHKD